MVVDADVVDDPIDPEASAGEAKTNVGHAQERERDVDVAGDELVPVDAMTAMPNNDGSACASAGYTVLTRPASTVATSA